MRRPFATWTTKGVPPAFSLPSAVAGLAWLVIGLALAGWWALSDASSGSPAAGTLIAALAVGSALQVLLGVGARVLPTRIGRSPAAAGAASTELERWGTARVVVTNLGLALFLLPTPPLVAAVLGVLAAVALLVSLPLLLLAVRAARTAPATTDPSATARGVPARAASPAGPAWSRLELLTGAGIIALGTSVGVGVDPDAAGLGRRATGAGRHGVAATGRTRRVHVGARDMRFHPEEVTVDTGDRLVIDLENTDSTDIHDLVLATGVTSHRLSPGDRATLDVGLVGADIEGWCSVVGHRQMGMVFHIVATGAAQPSDHTSHAPAEQPTPQIDFQQGWSTDFTGIDPTLPPLTGSRVHEVTLTATDVTLEVAPGVTQVRWTYNGESAAPTLHGRVGDRFVVTLVNEGSMGHSVDFHASAIAPDRAMRTIPPGESLRYEFTALRSGIWMYHCATHPMSLHIAAGMAGAVVIEPDGLPEVDRSYLITQSELYLGGPGEPVDAAKVAAQEADAVVFNGYVNQYVDRPLAATVGERVRIWVLDIGPNRPLSFHVIGTQLDTVYKEGSYRLDRGRGPLDPPGATSGGSQALGLLAAQGGFVELTFPEAGHYPFVNHIMSDGEKGARGLFDVR